MTPTEKQYWTLDQEMEWLSSVLARMTTTTDKIKFVRSYLTSLSLRHEAFDGQGPMDKAEYQDMTTYCLRQLYLLEGGE